MNCIFILEGKAIKNINVFVVARILLGCIFIVSGFEKLISPYENFLYIVQGYELGNRLLEDVTAQIIPWVEFLTGVFLLLGLHLKFTLRVAWFLWAAFIVIIIQAIWRNLPLDECGCFGSLITLPLPATMTLDILLLILTTLARKFIDKTSAFSLDRFFQKNSQ